MGQEDFLKNLKDAVETGNFNSEAAKKINEIVELADGKIIEKTVEELEDAVEQRVEDSGVKSIPEEELEDVKSVVMTEYEEKMKNSALVEVVGKINIYNDKIGIIVENLKFLKM